MNEFAITIFPHISGRFKTEEVHTLSSLCELIKKTTAPTKDQLPLIKLARFGNAVKDEKKRCLRWDGNVLSITGIEVDYDGGKIAFDEARDRLRNKNIRSVIYTSPSHTRGYPRWRILCPFTRELPPKDRARMVARLNGVFGGALAPESFTLSQAFYFGHIEKPIDEVMLDVN